MRTHNKASPPDELRLIRAGGCIGGRRLRGQDPQCTPHYFPDYRSIPGEDSDQRWVDRIYPDGKWEANLFQFYRRVLPKLQEVLPSPFELEGNQRKDETPAHIALREAFVNCCVHADYGESTSLKILRYPDRIVFSNPGILLISRSQYYEGGESVCRNPSLQKMFMRIGAAERAGSGTGKIFLGWRSIGWKAPSPHEETEPNKIILLMPLESLLDERIECALRAQLGEERWYQLDQEERTILSTAYTEKIINHQCVRASSTLHPADITHRLQHLVREGYLFSQGHGRGTTYTLNPDTYSIEEIYALCPNMDSSSANMGTSPANMGTSSTNMGTSPANIGTSESRKPSKMPFAKMRLLILGYCDQWRSLEQIANYTERTKEYLGTFILPKLSEDLCKRFPQKNHPNQMYRRRDVQESDSE